MTWGLTYFDEFRHFNSLRSLSLALSPALLLSKMRGNVSKLFQWPLGQTDIINVLSLASHSCIVKTDAQADLSLHWALSSLFDL